MWIRRISQQRGDLWLELERLDDRREDYDDDDEVDGGGADDCCGDDADYGDGNSGRELDASDDEDEQESRETAAE